MLYFSIKNMTKLKPTYDVVVVRRKKIQYKHWPSEKDSTSDKVPQYVSVITHVEPEEIENVLKEISKRHQIKGIFCLKV